MSLEWEALNRGEDNDEYLNESLETDRLNSDSICFANFVKLWKI